MAYGVGAAITHVSLFVAFILMLITTLSVPIIKSVWLMRANVKVGTSFLSAKDTITFGVWGLCFGGGEASFLGFHGQADSDCTKPKLGYSTEFSSNPHVKNLLKGSAAKTLVFHPLATAFIFLALVASLIAHHQSQRLSTPRKHKLFSIFELVTNSLASLCTTLAFTLDITAASKAKNAAKDSDGIVSVTYGNTCWLSLVAALLIWAAKIMSCLAVRKRRQRAAKERAISERY